ncbi:formamidopyrimidine/5-formyluracil/ 5-hydroxymethyluracil DNA glycosylase, partial [Pasteurella multocida subsp. multocida str. Anand1_cattle]
WMVSEELAQITHKKYIALSRRAKYLIIQLETGYMIGHLGMSGVIEGGGEKVILSTNMIILIL